MIAFVMFASRRQALSRGGGVLFDLVEFFPLLRRRGGDGPWRGRMGLGGLRWGHKPNGPVRKPNNCVAGDKK